ncbi:hypothetical protein ACUSIJ_22670 [Pseudochelatococcus sp. B33]
MAIITPSTFDPLHRFVSVRLQQGVPIVDADWNEMDDLRRFELRSYLKWFVGDGVPEGSDGFRCAARAVFAANDFDILAGVPAPPPGTPNLVQGLRHMGRCLVEGGEALIHADVNFRAQDLHVAAPGSAARAAAQGVPQIDEIPVLDGTVCLYLDLWDRLVRPDEMPTLVFPDIGTESCARMRAEWAVRARVGTAVPASGDADFIAGHSYYALTLLERVAADPVVYPGQLTDLREKRLLTPPAHLIEDLFGNSPADYRRGQDRPALPFRTVLNALLRGELPGTDDQVIAPDPANDFATRAIVATDTDIVTAFHSLRVGGTPKIFVTSWKDASPEDADAAPLQVTALDAQTAALLMLPTLPFPAPLLAYSTQNDIRFRRAAALGGLAGAAETPVAATADIETHPLVLLTGQIVTFLWHRNGPGTDDNIRYRRRQYDATWTEAAAVWLEADTVDLSPLQPSTTLAEPWAFHAAADAAGRLFVAFRTATDNIAVARLTPTSGAVETWANHTIDSGTSDREPFVLVEGAAQVHVFLRADSGISMATHDVAANSWSAPVPVPGTSEGAAGSNQRPAALFDDDGGLWLFWSKQVAIGPKTDVWCVYRNPNTLAWGAPRQVTGSPGNNDFPVVFEKDGALRLFFRSNRSGNFDFFFKTIATRI